MGLGCFNDCLKYSEGEKQQNIKNAISFALVVSIVLAVLKVGSFWFLNSLAIYASALDSLMDIGVSAVNFAIIRLTMKKSNARFSYGYDKLSAFVALIQVAFIGFLSIDIIKEGINKLFNPEDLAHSEIGIAIIVFSVFASLLVVLYQRRVVKSTGSMIIRAEMIHYTSDTLTNIAILGGLIGMKMFDVPWIDPIIGIAAAIYVLISSMFLAWRALSSLLDMSDVIFMSKVVDVLNEKGFAIELSDVAVRFSGLRKIIDLKLSFKKGDDMEEFAEKMHSAKLLLQQNFEGSLVNILVV